VFGNRVVRRIVGHKRKEVVSNGKYCIMKSFIMYTLHEIFIR
jgi:hypothetical protein